MSYNTLVPVAPVNPSTVSPFGLPTSLDDSGSSGGTGGSNTGDNENFSNSLLERLAQLGIIASNNDAGGLTVDASNQSTGVNFSSESPSQTRLTELLDELNLGSADDFAQLLGGDDIANTGDGNDRIEANQGNDRVSLGGGNDTGYGGKGDDTVSGDDGDDLLFGDLGNDRVSGGLGADTVSGGQGDDTVSGDDGNDTVGGNQGNDSVDGGSGDDRVYGGQGDDRVFGGDGNDTLSGDAGHDTVTGGSGADVFRFEYFVQQGPLQTAEEVGTNPVGVDTITDFNPGEDQIQLDKRIFASLGDAIEPGEVEVINNFDPQQSRNCGKNHLRPHHRSGVLQSQ